MELIDTLKGYRFDKDKLIDIYNNNDFQDRVRITHIKQLIDNNKDYKQRYEELLEDVRFSIKDQLKRKFA